MSCHQKTDVDTVAALGRVFGNNQANFVNAAYRTVSSLHVGLTHPETLGRDSAPGGQACA